MKYFKSIFFLPADERGRWWIVGSAWTGHLPGESSSSEKSDRLKKSESKTTEGYTLELLELARKQRMNTDTRRNIFCILLTAEVSSILNFFFMKFPNFFKRFFFFHRIILMPSRNCYIST